MSRGGTTLAILAGFMGAAGVALAAVAAHKVQSPALASAAQMLMVHAAAALALVALARQAARPGLWMLAAVLVVIGSVLFATAVSLPVLAGVGVVAGTAPLGGTAVIIGWLVAAVAAAVA